jgi:DNA polymerase III epsilon subunit family exonuclease
MPPTYAVVDVETTGCRADADRVIEVAVVRVARRRIVDRWRSFCRPDRPVPAWIRALTGITDAHLREAPAFDDIAADLARRLHGCVFVAHNAAFDAAFLRAEFARAGRRWDAPALCTVRLGRRLVPGLPSHSLDAAAAHAGIEIAGRHRALGDAEAAAGLLVRYLALPGARRAIVAMSRARDARPLPPGADDLPRGIGLWILRDAAGAVLRAGRAVNLHDGFREEFAALPGKLARRAARVDFEAAASLTEAEAREAELAPAAEPAFLVVAPDGRLTAGPPGPGRLYGPFRSLADLRRRMKRAEGLPVEDAVAEIIRGLKPLGLLRPPAPSGPGELVRDGERLLWIQEGRLRRAWTLGADTDEGQLRDEIRALLRQPARLGGRVRARRGVPVEEFLEAP